MVGNTSASLLLSEKFPVVCVSCSTVVADAPVHILETFSVGSNYYVSIILSFYILKLLIKGTVEPRLSGLMKMVLNSLDSKNMNIDEPK